MAALSEEKNKSNGFMSGVLVLSLSAVIVKIIGLIYKIPMLRLLGSEGMGYFNSAYEIYTLFCTVATTGLPVAMAVMISSSGDRCISKGQKVFSVAVKLFLLLGTLGSLIMVVFAKPFAAFVGGDGTVGCIFAIAPTVFLVCMSSAYKGYFQGLGKMSPTAVSQMIEALGKLALGLLFAFLALNSGANTETVAAFAVFGLTLGNAASLLYLVSARCFGVKEKKAEIDDASDKKLAAELLKTAIPITLSSAVISLTKVIDMTVILKRLQGMGVSSANAFASYGNYTTLALPLFGLAPALISSVALPLVPALSRAVAENDGEGQKKTIGDAVGLTLLLAMPISVGLTMFSEPILNLIFQGETQAIPESAPLLALLGPSVTLACMITVSNAILQAYGAPSVPILSMAIGSLVKIVLAYLLIGIEPIGLAGAPISTFICDLIINVVNFAFIEKYIDSIPDFCGMLLRPFLMSALAVSVARLFYNMSAESEFSSTTATVIAVLIAGVVYCISAILMGEPKRYGLKVKLVNNH